MKRRIDCTSHGRSRGGCVAVLLQNTLKPKRQVPDLGVGVNLDLSKLDVCFGGFTPFSLSDENASREQVEAAEERARARRESLEQAARLEAARASEERSCVGEDATTWTYVVLDGASVRIEHCETSCEVLTVPDRIEGLPVEALAADSCAHLAKTVEVRVPDSVVSIGYCAFRFSPRLEKAVLPRDLATYDSGWFRSCPRLRHLVLPGGLHMIDSSVFDAESLKVLKIGASACEVAPGAFSKSKLDRIEVDEDNPFLSTDGLALYNESRTAFIALAVPAERYAVASGCLGVAKKAFCDRRELREVELPEGLEVIGPFAFAHTSLEEFKAPSSLAHIGERAFFECSSLCSVDLGQGLLTLADHAFTSTGIKNLTVPASIEGLGNPVAAHCGLTYAGPDATFRIAPGSAVLSLDVQGGLYQVREDGPHLIRMMDPAVKRYEVAEGTVEIDPGAFAGHGSLEAVVLPEGLARIGAEAFKDCRALRRVSVPDSLRVVEAEAFYGTVLETFRIPRDLESIGVRALVTRGSRHDDEAPTLRTVKVSRDNRRFAVLPGLLIEHLDSGADRVVLCTDDVDEVRVPANVTEIAAYAFNGVRNVKRLYLSERIATVGIRGLAVDCLLDLIHVDLAEPLCGKSFVEVRFPDTDRSRQQMMLALSVPDFVNVEAIMSHYDAAVVNAHSFDAESSQGLSLYEQSVRILERLRSPVYLSQVNRDMFVRVLERNIEQVCVEMAKHDDRRSIDELVADGFLNAGNIVSVIERVGAVQDASMTGYLLELQRERFGSRRAFDDFDL